jgi:type II secretory pathway component GspD/PulD (secretin)
MNKNKSVWAFLTGKTALILVLFFMVISPLHVSAHNSVSAQFNNTDIKAVLSSISDIAGAPLIMSGGLTGTVTAHFSDTPFEQALDQLAQTFNFTWADSNGTIIIAPADAMTTTIKTFKVKYLDLENLKAQIALFVDAKKVSVNTDDSSVTVDTTPTNLKKIHGLIDEKDVPPYQIFIQARVLEISADDEEKLGSTFSWNRYAQGTPFNLGLTSTLSAEATLKHSKLITRPSVLTYNGKKASINLTDKVPILQVTTSNGTTSITADYKDVGIKLDVTPRVNVTDGDRSVTMQVHPLISLITGFTTYINNGSSNSYPTISSREVDTMVRIKDGETLVIGGLLKADDIRTMTRIPILCDLPFLGRLFRYHDNEKVNREVIVFITPHIVEANEKTTDFADNMHETSK